MPTPTLETVAAAQDRIEQRQADFEVVTRRILGCLEAQTEKLNALLAVTGVLPNSSLVQELLAGILAAMQHQATALEALPGSIVQVLREDAAAGLTGKDINTEGAAR